MVIELFSGAGGSSLGFDKAGFEIELAIEINPSACKTYRYNHPNVVCVNDDITKL